MCSALWAALFKIEEKSFEIKTTDNLINFGGPSFLKLLKLFFVLFHCSCVCIVNVLLKLFPKFVDVLMIRLPTS
jgi:hypothetical protein